ncbi:RAMP superfamily CRISPR-associated protein [Microcoleus sp. F8-D3]
MQYDYYAFRKEQLGETLNELDRAKVELDEAKQRKDKNARQQAERKIEQAAENKVKLEPHLSYLWYEARNSELKNSLRDAWQKHLNASIIPNAFHFTPELSALNYLPPLSFMLRFPFKLKKPYLSKDDRTFYLLDNPVRKDKVFQTPMVASTSWKGVLRATFWQLGHQKDNEQIIRLFGDAREDEKGQAGRLYFYPTFFDKIGLEVINPHDRKTGTGKNPILIESVPVGATGEFVLLYVPFGKIDETQIAKDLELIAEGVEAMLAVYGFGAKTSSGFGIAEVIGKVAFAIRADWSELKPPEPQVKPPETDLPRYLIAPGQIDPDFLKPDGSFKSEAEYIQGKSAKKAKQLYDKAKKWWDSEQIRLAESAKVELISKPEPLQKIPISEVSFDKLSDLGDRAKEITERLHQEEISHDS